MKRLAQELEGINYLRLAKRAAVTPGAVTAVYMTADVLAIALSIAAAVLARGSLGGLDIALYLPLWPVVWLFVMVYTIVGLYPGIGQAPAEELRRLTLASTLVYLVLGVGTFLFKEGEAYSRAVFLGAWALTILFVPLSRALVRNLFARRSWWGKPVVVLGAGDTGKMVVRALNRNPGLGLKPIAALDDDPGKRSAIDDVPVLGGVDLAPLLARELKVRHAIVAMPGVERKKLLNILEGYAGVFPHLVLIPDLFGFSSLWVSAQDLGGVLGLEIRQRLLLTGPRLTKRMVDLVLTLVGGLLVLPLIVLIAILIKLDSRGPVFYFQDRLGKDGRVFKAVKFRSMYGDGETRLARLLEENPHLKEEYEIYHKLRDDPRVTRIGRILRKLSLDELPQLWNVLRGEMSLVGPRAYLPRELPKMNGSERIILKVLPGITGLWQVSGRSEIPFPQRLEIDAYYVRNWSVWLDLYILARTVWVVLFSRGAY
ncbi:Undecaprenyl-phosphate galactose phosphotransferase, WbaP [Oceanithermus profundus DSM 14977]|uniref:Undecaprenyl-phosphate galactose phosphotransferase, WbaP n=1 Tax=Oceanithermus profundus (strain DSM 14977 / NBRC 100410 / VKM B-2274 / 506) TaxID=670487 RepID=E4U5D7_OCEP5|nr:undecaprenyl-phosphate galactose phosphotransferase WbaP [Oceanithermus profundus]ADR37611.1 Undecaprenyl-phosphate galactose phosphotransferase, WbaP [Oceanithermus profundus DSM 14977]